MSLIPIDAEYHFVQDTAPTPANAGDVWLDTSQNPPVAKIYADVGNGLEWLKDQASSRIDIPVSSAGASISDIEQGAEDALEEDIANMSPASNSVAANLDGGVAAVDWSSKTAKAETVTKIVDLDRDVATNILSITGSGYLVNAMIGLDGNEFDKKAQLFIDGQMLDSTPLQLGSDNQSSVRAREHYNGNATGYTGIDWSGIHRFDSSVELKIFNDGDFNSNNKAVSAGVDYVFD